MDAGEPFFKVSLHFRKLRNSPIMVDLGAESTFINADFKRK